MPRKLSLPPPWLYVVSNARIHKTRLVEFARCSGIAFAVSELCAGNHACSSAAPASKSILSSAELRRRSDDQPQNGGGNGSGEPLFVHVVGEFTPRLPVRRIGIIDWNFRQAKAGVAGPNSWRHHPAARIRKLRDVLAVEERYFLIRAPSDGRYDLVHTNFEKDRHP